MFMRRFLLTRQELIIHTFDSQVNNFFKIIFQVVLLTPQCRSTRYNYTGILPQTQH